MSTSSLDEVTNRLIINYDQNFNELYDKILVLNSSIMNKEEILAKERLEMGNKDLNIEYLNSILVFIILFSLLLFAHALKKIDTGKLIIGTILLLLLLFLVCYYLYKRSLDLPNYMKNAFVKMDDFYESALHKLVENPYKCPAECPTKNSEPIDSEDLSINGNVSPTLITDPQDNVWQDGTFYEPFISSVITDKQLTYYDCKWLGGTINGNSLPIQDKKKYSTIPCNYKENYTQVKKLICKDDPNIKGDNSDNCTVNLSSY
jgi:hypothetical protein